MNRTVAVTVAAIAEGALRPLAPPAGVDALAATAPYAPDAQRGQASLDDARERVQGIRDKAMTQLSGYSPEEQTRHTLGVEDGR
jgi:hypothetical protein